MKISASALQDMLDLYRQALNLEIPVADDFKIHFMRNRLELLRNFTTVGNTCSMLISVMTPESEEDETELERMKIIAYKFRTWAATELDALESLSGEDE